MINISDESGLSTKEIYDDYTEELLLWCDESYDVEYLTNDDNELPF